MGAMFDAWASKGRDIDERLMTIKRGMTDPAEIKAEDDYFEAEYKGRKDLVESVGASGGFLVPTEFYSQLMAVEGESGIVRPRATKIRMNRRAGGHPHPGSDRHYRGRSSLVWRDAVLLAGGSDLQDRDAAQVPQDQPGCPQADWLHRSVR